MPRKAVFKFAAANGTRFQTINVYPTLIARAMNPVMGTKELGFNPTPMVPQIKLRPIKEYKVICTNFVGKNIMVANMDVETIDPKAPEIEAT